MKWLKHNWAFVMLAIVTVVAIAFFVQYRSDNNRLAALGSLFGFIVTALLVFITIEYVRTNQKTLRLLEAQWEAQNEVEIKFGLRARGETAQVWVLNYGLATVVVTKLLVEMQNRSAIPIYKNMVLRPGAKKFFHLPHRQWGKLALKQNIQLTLLCESTTEKVEETKVFTLSLTDDSKVYKVRRGLRGLWPVGCPKCEKFMGICMVTDELHSFDEARARQKEMEAELVASCPQHASKWILTMEHVTKPEPEDIDV